MFIPLHDANAMRHIRIQWVTLAIIIVNVLVWLGFGTTLTGSGQFAISQTILGYGYIPAVALESVTNDYAQTPIWATYVTYSFLHADFMHLAGNMLFIWVFGDNVEDAMGHVKYLLFYLLCAAAGAFLHGIVDTDSQSPLIGASGAAAGIITAYVLLHPRVKVWILALGRIPLRLSALWVVGAWIAFQFFNFVASEGDNVSWAAHIGGILAGAVLMPVLKRRGVRLFDMTPVDEVLPPVPPPATADEGWPLPGQPMPQGNREDAAGGQKRPESPTSAAAEPAGAGDDTPQPPAAPPGSGPWGRQAR